jgi:cytochrome c biogenesis protein CcmG, thiol:disulfide interchange protein DsbE
MQYSNQQSEQTDESSQKPPPITGVTILLLVVVGLWAFWFVFAYVIAPRLPRRVILNPENHAGVGEQLLHLKLLPLTGSASPVSASDLKNHVTLLNFWGTWCPPCRVELPHIAELRKRFAGHAEFNLLAVSCPSFDQREDRQSLQEETEALMKQLGLDLPTYFDPEGTTQAAVDQSINFEGFPTTLLLDQRGTIRAVWSGYRPGMETEVERYVAKVLGEGKAEEQPEP